MLKATRVCKASCLSAVSRCYSCSSYDDVQGLSFSLLFVYAVSCLSAGYFSKFQFDFDKTFNVTLYLG